MEISVEVETGKVRQHGVGLGELSGCIVERLTDDEEPVVRTLLGQVSGDGYVRFNLADRGLSRVTTSDEWQATATARVAEDEQLRALVAAHADPLLQALAKRFGLG